MRAPITPGFRVPAFTILAAASRSWTEGFTIDYATSINWTATAIVPFDANLANNAVSATTRVTGGGGQPQVTTGSSGITRRARDRAK